MFIEPKNEKELCVECVTIDAKWRSGQYGRAVATEIQIILAADSFVLKKTPKQTVYC